MAINRGSVDSYLRDGCGRCDLYQTPACKVQRWPEVLRALRALVLECGLAEELKWGSPCYSLESGNVLMIGALNDECRLSFFKGAALRDEAGLLVPPGPHSRYARMLVFRSLDDVMGRRDVVRAYIQQAIELERAGVKVEVPSGPEALPDELAQRLNGDPALAEAFAALTPGRQRSHILHVLGAKQSATRERRADALVPLILAGRGFHER